MNSDEIMTTATSDNTSEDTSSVQETNQVLDNQPAETVQATEQTPVAEQTQEPAASEVPQESAEAEAEKKSRKSARQEQIEKIFEEVQQAKDKDEQIEVEITGRIRGGLRVVFKELPMFLPASHYSLKRTPTETELQEAIGSKILVNIHEIQEYDEGRKAIIVSRKKNLVEDFWGKINIGDIVEGKVSSVASFGVFVDIGGLEGLVHISRLSQVHVGDPAQLYKKGDPIQTVIVELDKEKNRIALSRKELEPHPWKGAEELFPIGSQHTGIVRRLTDFGAYIELKPGVDGLLRAGELSWTKRVKHPSDVLKVGQEIQVEILSVSEEKQTVSLSYKKTLPNPWGQLVERFPIDTELEGKVIQVMPQGAIISISDDVDGFMPRSKMRSILKGKKIPYSSGDTLTVIISDLNPDEESLILAPKVDEEQLAAAEAAAQYEERPERSERRPREFNKDKAPAAPKGNSSFSLGDLISQQDMEKLSSISK